MEKLVDHANQANIKDYNYIANLVGTLQPSVSSIKETVGTLTPNEKKLYLYFQMLTMINMLHGVTKLSVREAVNQIKERDRNAVVVDIEPQIDRIKDDLLSMIECIRLV